MTANFLKLSFQIVFSSEEYFILGSVWPLEEFFFLWELELFTVQYYSYWLKPNKILAILRLRSIYLTSFLPGWSGSSSKLCEFFKIKKIVFKDNLLNFFSLIISSTGLLLWINSHKRFGNHSTIINKDRKAKILNLYWICNVL